MCSAWGALSFPHSQIFFSWVYRDSVEVDAKCRLIPNNLFLPLLQNRVMFLSVVDKMLIK